MANKNEYNSAIQFLCSDASKFLNGHNLIMDGGRTVWQMKKFKRSDIIAIITARKGSKELKNKNIKKILGHPLIAYSIIAAKSNI